MSNVDKTLKQETIKQLRTILKDLYPVSTSIQRVLDDSGVDHSMIKFVSVSVDDWHAVLSEAYKHGKIDVILQTAMADYPNNSVLREAFLTYNGTSSGRSTVNSTKWSTSSDSIHRRKKNESQSKFLRMLLEHIRIQGDVDNLEFLSRLILENHMVQFDVDEFLAVLKSSTLDWLKYLRTEEDHRALIKIAIIMIASISLDLSNSSSDKQFVDSAKEFFNECKERLLAGPKHEFIDEILSCLDSYPSKIIEERRPVSSLV